jgi:uncharacterized iron-regulated membrane protein
MPFAVRPWLVRLHRWFGLATALFLFLSGLTGAIIAWYPSLDAALNPDFYQARSHSAQPLTPLALADLVEASNPRLHVSYLPLQLAAGRTLQMRVEPKIDPASGKAYPLDYDQIAVDPATGEIQGRRLWGAPGFDRLHLMPFLYRFHYTLSLPTLHSGLQVGIWLLGIVGIVWFFDCFIALVLAFPKPSAWRKSFAFRRGRGAYTLTFDLHRSGGTWIWLLLLMMATTSISMNLAEPVVRPLLAGLFQLAPEPGTLYAQLPPRPAGTPLASRAQIVAAATAEGPRLGIAAPPGALFQVGQSRFYGVGYTRATDDFPRGLGTPWLYWDGASGRRFAASIPGRGSAGDIFLQVQYPLHSGRILGLPGRIAISACGLMVALLSATGIVIWLKKRGARRRAHLARVHSSRNRNFFCMRRKNHKAKKLSSSGSGL